MAQAMFPAPTHDLAEQPNRLPWPPLLYGLMLVVPWLLAAILPLPEIAIGPFWDDVRIALGWALMAWGLVVAWLAIRSFQGVGTPVDPRARAERLVTFGIYNRTRNPMYLGALLAFAGLALATGNLWRLVALPLFVVAVTRLAIEREEAHLAARFGAAFEAYRSRVNRWV